MHHSSFSYIIFIYEAVKIISFNFICNRYAKGSELLFVTILRRKKLGFIELLI